MVTKFEKTTVTVDLGALGQIKALSLTPQASSSPTCNYIGGLPYALPPTGQYRFRPPRPLPEGYSYGTRANPGSFTGETAWCPQSGLQGDDDALWDEACLSMNIWIPSGTPPTSGWPILFNIHGGFLQFSNANNPPEVIADLLHETPFKAVVVMPAYRLNLFGFLASRELEEDALRLGETVGNQGFWDQRMALEWVANHASLLKGDSSKITVAGYSAGSHSAFAQLAHDLDRPEEERLIGRVIMWSNGPGCQPKFIEEHQKQFDELISRLGIDATLESAEKVQKLKAMPARALVDVQKHMKLSEFRAVSDGAFVNKTLIEDINNGTFAKKLKARGVKILNGECSEEWFMYGIWRPPPPGYDNLYTRLIADYPESTVNAVLPLYFPNKELDGRFRDWFDAFGKVYSDLQIYTRERGFAKALDDNGFKAGEDLLRYRIAWRAKCVDSIIPQNFGATHSTDMTIWFWGGGWGEGLSDSEKKVLAPLNQIFADFVGFKDVQWPVKDPKAMLRLDSNGEVGMWTDELWDHGQELWQAVSSAGNDRAKM